MTPWAPDKCPTAGVLSARIDAKNYGSTHIVSKVRGRMARACPKIRQNWSIGCFIAFDRRRGIAVWPVSARMVRCCRGGRDRPV